MTPEDHYAAAEKLIAELADAIEDDTDGRRVAHLHLRAAEVGWQAPKRFEVKPAINVAIPDAPGLKRVADAFGVHLEPDGTAPAVPTMREPVVQPTPQFRQAASQPGLLGDRRAHVLAQGWNVDGEAMWLRCSCGGWEDQGVTLHEMFISLHSWREHVDLHTEVPF